MDTLVTGASRGIGRALALALARRGAPGDRVFALARDLGRLEALAGEAPGPARIVPVELDLSRLERAQKVGRELCAEVADAVLVHDAGVWPTTCQRVDGLEIGFLTNCLGPLALQAPLLEAGRLRRVLVVSAGLLVKGRFDPDHTPTGADFSPFRTYCSTKLAGAAAMRDVARWYPTVDFAVVHPGVVRTDLGALRGPLGALLGLIKRRWESPETCAARLCRLLDRPRWAEVPGEAPWFFEADEAPWPVVVDRVQPAVATAVRRYG